jgi:hypothetical protein
MATGVMVTEVGSAVEVVFAAACKGVAGSANAGTAVGVLEPPRVAVRGPLGPRFELVLQ